MTRFPHDRFAKDYLKDVISMECDREMQSLLLGDRILIQMKVRSHSGKDRSAIAFWRKMGVRSLLTGSFHHQ